MDEHADHLLRAPVGDTSARLMVSPKEAAELLGIGRTLCYSLIKSGEIPSRHLGRLVRVPLSALRALAEAQPRAEGVRLVKRAG